MAATSVVDLFADLGMLAHDQGVLPGALEELSTRLDLAGAGGLLTVLAQRCFAPETGVDHCPTCGADLKRPPGDPHPKPTSPPPPPPPPPPPDGAA